MIFTDFDSHAPLGIGLFHSVRFSTIHQVILAYQLT